MRKKLQIKVCWITNLSDAELAAECGADFLGFIFYQKSPRSLDPETFRAFHAKLPSIKRVYVQVRPQPEELRRASTEGFDFFQLHFSPLEDASLVQQWTEIVGPEKLWLAPRILPGEDFPAAFLGSAATFLIDTYHKNRFGGTGQTGDWDRFRVWSESMPEKRWVLAGGLTPENVQAALRESGTSVVDVSSGIEEKPGRKSQPRMREFFAAINASR